MKNVSSLQSSNVNSPKTPGGISKSLLTPCRRVGLSRNWKKKGPSPFISPISSTPEVIDEKTESRKRKSTVKIEENLEQTPQYDNVEIVKTTSEIDKTPSRNVELPRRKKSKTFLATINKPEDDLSSSLTTTQANVKTESIVPHIVENVAENINVVSTPVRTKSKKGKKHTSPKATPKDDKKCDISNTDTNDTNEPTYSIKEKSPNELKKECVVVIQRKIFKKLDNTESKENVLNNEPIPKEEKINNIGKVKTSQTLFDSDSDDVPLTHLNKDTLKLKTNNDDDDFDTNSKIKEHKINKKSPKTKLKTAKKVINKPDIVKTDQKFIPKPLQSSFDDDDDDFDEKRTILIKRTYDKIVKPMKAKSTGSITQIDIDNLKARIDAKKKLLLAQAVTPDTKELRDLIKKWQKGCQDALMELMDLMKSKFNDKQNMDYAQMLDSLKIPHSLVGYDSDNDCFNSPDDALIISGQF